MTIKLGVIIDPLNSIKPEKDTTVALLLEAQSRNWATSIMHTEEISLNNHKILAKTRSISVQDNAIDWCILGDDKTEELNQFDVILMRKDPPVNSQYIYITYLLEMVRDMGVLVCNDPTSLRDLNEKMVISQFPECSPPTLISQQRAEIAAFVEQQQNVVIKPLDGMGGNRIFKLHAEDANVNVITEVMTENESQFVIAQKYIPESTEGDKRVLLINGEPLKHALLRVPKAGEFRGNLARGATAVATEINDRDRWICERIKPLLIEKQLTFVGIDIIGDYLTEINVTSPTCVREIDAGFDINISAKILDAIETRLNA